MQLYHIVLLIYSVHFIIINKITFNLFMNKILINYYNFIYLKLLLSNILLN